ISQTDPGLTRCTVRCFANSDGPDSAQTISCRGRHSPACTPCCAAACADARGTRASLLRLFVGPSAETTTWALACHPRERTTPGAALLAAARREGGYGVTDARWRSRL